MWVMNMKSPEWYFQDISFLRRCLLQPHSFIHSFSASASPAHRVAAVLQPLPAVLGWRRGFVLDESQHSETNTVKLTMLSLGGSGANTAVYIPLAWCLNSQIKSWSWSLVFFFWVFFLTSRFSFPDNSLQFHFYQSSFIHPLLFLRSY